MAQAATTPIEEKDFPVLLAQGLVTLYQQLLRERGALVKDTLYQYLAGTLSAKAVVEQIASLEDFGAQRIAEQSVLLLRRLQPKSSPSAGDVDFQWVAWPDAGC